MVWANHHLRGGVLLAAGFSMGVLCVGCLLLWAAQYQAYDKESHALKRRLLVLEGIGCDLGGPTPIPLEELRHSLASARSDLEKLEQRLPPALEVEAFLGRVRAKAARHRVALRVLDIDKKNLDFYSEARISAVLTGRTSNLLAVAGEIEAGERLVSWESARHETAPGLDGEARLPVTIDVYAVRPSSPIQREAPSCALDEPSAWLPPYSIRLARLRQCFSRMCQLVHQDPARGSIWLEAETTRKAVEEIAAALEALEEHRTPLPHL